MNETMSLCEDDNIGAQRACTHVMNEVTLRCMCSVNIAVGIQLTPGENNQVEKTVYSKSKAPPLIRPQPADEEHTGHERRVREAGRKTERT